MSSTSSKLAAFRREVWNHYKTQGRHTLPWRTTKDPYQILVSEVMLQQTQVERVIPYYLAWMKRFPSAEALARAPLSSVLKAWQGLGYNRRAKNLHMAAKAAGNLFPKTIAELEALPGIGSYTARAVAAFAYNQDVVFIETNIRTVVIRHFFANRKTVTDAQITKVLEKALPRGKARAWYSALMDYGAFLKRSGVRLNARTKGYTKQTRFQGSSREARGALLKALAKGGRTGTFLADLLGPQRRTQVRMQLSLLVKEGLVEFRRGKFRLPG